MAPSRLDLVKIGQEGFAMLDEFFGPHKGATGKKKQPPPPPLPSPSPPPPPPPVGPPPQKYMAYRYERQPQKPHVCEVIVPAPAASEETVVAMNCYEVAKLYGGTVIVDHRYPDAGKAPMRKA